MTSNAPTEPDVETMRAVHDAASEQIDPLPNARVRAAVLAEATATIAARQRRATGNPFRAGRWPLSMAAVLVVSVMTGVMVTRTMRDDPDRVTTVAAVAPPVSPAVKDVRPPKADDASRPAQQPAVQPTVVQPNVSRPREASRPKTASSPSTGASADAAPASIEREPSRSVSNGATPWPASPSAAPNMTSSSTASAPAASPAPPPPAPAQAAPPSTQTESVGRLIAPPPNSVQAASRQAPTRDASTSDRAKVYASSLRRSGEEKSTGEPATPEAWVERIVKLRTGGDDAAADRELDALRARYPDFTIPAAALNATGTR